MTQFYLESDQMVFGVWRKAVGKLMDICVFSDREFVGDPKQFRSALPTCVHTKNLLKKTNRERMFQIFDFMVFN